jgi:hypothetical protein
VSFGYQSDKSEDQDPDNEPALYGGTPKNALGKGVSAIMVEAVRELWIGGNTVNVLPGPHQDLQTARETYWNLIAGDIGHEIGHSPGGNSGNSDHAELGLMADTFIQPYATTPGQTQHIIDPYSAPTIKRFRTAHSWLP